MRHQQAKELNEMIESGNCRVFVSWNDGLEEVMRVNVWYGDENYLSAENTNGDLMLFKPFQVRVYELTNWHRNGKLVPK